MMSLGDRRSVLPWVLKQRRQNADRKSVLGQTRIRRPHSSRMPCAPRAPLFTVSLGSGGLEKKGAVGARLNLTGDFCLRLKITLSRPWHRALRENPLVFPRLPWRRGLVLPICGA